MPVTVGLSTVEMPIAPDGRIAIDSMFSPVVVRPTSVALK
jgi:hypothetical protein